MKEDNKIYPENNNFSDNNNREKKSSENKNKNNYLEILFRIFCFQEELKEKIKNKKNDKIQLGILLDKELMRKIKMNYEYETFVNLIKKSKLYNNFKDKKAIINSEQLDNADFLLKIMKEFIYENPNFISNINDKVINADEINNKKIKIYKKKDKINLYYVENFEIVNIKIFELLTKQFDIKNYQINCHYFIGKNNYFFLHIYIGMQSIPIITQISKFDNNDFQVEYIINFNNNSCNPLLLHLKEKGIDDLINYFNKNKKKTENEYIIITNIKLILYMKTKHLKKMKFFRN